MNTDKLVGVHVADIFFEPLCSFIDVLISCMSDIQSKNSMRTKEDDDMYGDECARTYIIIQFSRKLNLGYRIFMQRFKKDKIGTWPEWKELWLESWLTVVQGQSFIVSFSSPHICLQASFLISKTGATFPDLASSSV